MNLEKFEKKGNQKKEEFVTVINLNLLKTYNGVRPNKKTVINSKYLDIYLSNGFSKLDDYLKNLEQKEKEEIITEKQRKIDEELEKQKLDEKSKDQSEIDDLYEKNKQNGNSGELEKLIGELN